MGKAQPLPILITGGGRRIGLALAWHFINQKQPVIVSYRTHYPAIDGLINAGAQCIQADFSTNDGVMAFADEVLKSTHGLRAILHNASAWMAEKPGAPLADVLACMMQIHVNTPYLLNHALETLLRGGRNQHRRAVGRRDEMPVARIARVGHQDFIARLDQGKAGKLQRGRCACRDDDAAGGHVGTKARRIPAADALAQGG